jgi:hypothetical protein
VGLSGDKGGVWTGFCADKDDGAGVAICGQRQEWCQEGREIGAGRAVA